MKSALLYLLAGLFLALIVSMAWWTREVKLAREQATAYVVQPGDTVESVADRQGIPPEALAGANEMQTSASLQPGEKLIVPPHPPTAVEVWGVHAAGLGAEIVGVLMSFWLSLAAGLLPAGFRKQMLGIAIVLGLASYAAAQATVSDIPQLTPQLVFRAITDGFAWSAAFPLLARAFGMRETPPPLPPPPPAAVTTAPEV